MNQFIYPLVAVLLPLVACEITQGQVVGNSGSLARQLFLFDRNGDGRLDQRERAAMFPTAEKDPEPLDLELPLICDQRTEGTAGGGRVDSETQNDRTANLQMSIALNWPVIQSGNNPSEQQDAPARQAAREEANTNDDQSTAVTSYPAPEDRSPEPELPPARSLGHSKAVQYRMLRNLRLSQPEPVQYRQAAVFGATQGLVKREPSRYLPPVADCCAPARATFTLQVYER